MAWRDYWKAQDMLLHSWIKECLDIIGIAPNIKRLLFKCMEDWSSCTLDHTNGRSGYKQRHLSRRCAIIRVICDLSDPTDSCVKKSYGYKLNGVTINHLMYIDYLKLYAK